MGLARFKDCNSTPIRFDKLNFVPAVGSQITDGVVTITVSTNTAEGDGVMRNAM
jgi:hypothetical protein